MTKRDVDEDRLEAISGGNSVRINPVPEDDPNPLPPLPPIDVAPDEGVHDPSDGD